MIHDWDPGADTTGDTANYAALVINGATITIDSADQTTSSVITTATSNWGGKGTGAGTITAALTAANLETNNEQTLKVTMTFMIEGDSAAPVISFS